MIENNFKTLSPLVSVYMPTHNRGVLIERAIESVLNQSYKNIELIICSDGSTDETIDILNRYCALDSRVSFIVNDIPQGACFSRNRCIELAKGEFITGLDDDDEFTEERIELFVKKNQSTNRDILCATRYYKNDEGVKVGDIYEGEITCEMMGNANWIGNQLFTRTSYLKELGGFDVKFPAWQDYDMWYRLVCKFGNCFKISSPTYIFYVDENRPRITTGSRAYAGYCMFIEKHANSLSKKQLKNLLFQDELNRGQKITFYTLLKNLTKSNLSIYTKNSIKKIRLVRYFYSFLGKKRKFS